MRRTARDLGTVALAAAGTLLVLAAYQFWQQQRKAPSNQPAAGQKIGSAAPKPAGQAAGPATARTDVKPAAEVALADAANAARGALGPDGEVLADGDFGPSGRQILAVQRLPSGAAIPAANAASTPSGSAASKPTSAGEEPETTAEVIRVSILVLDGESWKEAFRADEHLKNRRGYLPGSPAEPVPAWHLAYSKTADSGFRLKFTPAGLPQNRKQATVYAAWNGKRGEYDAVTAWGKGFLEPSPTPGNIPMPYKP